MAIKTDKEITLFPGGNGGVPVEEGGTASGAGRHDAAGNRRGTRQIYRRASGGEARGGCGVAESCSQAKIATGNRRRRAAEKYPDDWATGVGKTEIARRLARLAGCPFVKVEASKYTEVGYVGRDVESMVRDLVETSIDMVREEKLDEVAGSRGASRGGNACSTCCCLPR